MDHVIHLFLGFDKKVEDIEVQPINNGFECVYTNMYIYILIYTNTYIYINTEYPTYGAYTCITFYMCIVSIYIYVYPTSKLIPWTIYINSSRSDTLG